MAYDQIKESIKAVIKENGNYEITGNVLQAVLLSMVDTLGPEYQFLGIATKSTVPVVVEGNSFYITTEVGTYTNFKNSGNTTITVNQLGILTSTNGTAWNFTPIFIGVSKGGGEVFNDYDNNTAVGINSHAEGFQTHANKDNSHAEGRITVADGVASHAEGYQSGAFGANSHAEGQLNNARGVNSHAEGQETESVGINSHAEGFQTHANKDNSHAEGRITVADGVASHAEGYQSGAFGANSHAEGQLNNARGVNSHAEGQETESVGVNSHAEGQGTTAVGNNSHAEGAKTNAKGDNSHAEGNGGTATGTNSHVEGLETNTEGANSHAEGYQSGAFGANSHAEGQLNNARGVNSHAEGQETESVGVNSHAEGYQTHANKNNSHAEGRITVADGESSHAEGNETQTTGKWSHAEGYMSFSEGIASHAEGQHTTATGDYSHAEGTSTCALYINAHAEGQGTTAGAANAHAEGQGTVTSEVGGHVAGKYNAVVANGLFNFGIGSSNDKRKSAMIIDGTNGKVYFVGAGGYDGGTSIANAKSIQDILKDSGGVEIEQLDESFDFNKNAQFDVFNNIEDGLHIYVGTYRAQNTQIARMLRITQYTEAGETKVQYFEYQEEVGATSCSFINASVIRTESEGSWSWAQRAYELRMYMQAIPTNNDALSDSDKVILDRLISLVLYRYAITSFFYFNNSSELVPMTLARTTLQQQQVLEFTGIATGRKVISLKATRTNVGGSINYSNWSVTTIFLDQMNEIAAQADNLAQNIYVLNNLLRQSDEFGTKTISIASTIESMIGGSYIDVIQGPIRDSRKIFVSVLSNNDRKDLIVWNLKTVGNFQGGNNDNGELVFSTMYTNPETYSVVRRYIKLVITNSKFTVMTITTDAPIQNIYKPLLKVNIDSFKAKSGNTMTMDEINAAGITIQDVLDFRDGKKNMIQDISNLYFTLHLVGMMYVNNTEWSLCFESRISSNFGSNSILTGEMLCIKYSSNGRYNIHYAEI
jgi:autotransporter adhesin